jgi:4'-phosphopantetheinyl transferase
MAHAATIWLLDSRSIGDGALADFLGLLGPSEMARYRHFVRRERARQFVLGRALARALLGRLLGVPAGEVRLEEQGGQAPRLGNPGGARMGFSISHSGAWVGCAASGSTALGFDIEAIDPARDIAALCAQAFDDQENAWLAARPEAGRVRDFYQLWSEKEALFKLGGPGAQGCALNRPAIYRPALFHPELSIALCSEAPLASAELLPAALDPVPVGSVAG